MTEDLQKPPVIDLDALMNPISGENPSGENLRYSGLYDKINEARRADDPLALGDWTTSLKTADYKGVIGLAVPALLTETKDLQVASWLTESLIREYGFVGLRDSLKLLIGLQENFWDTLHPEIDDGDMEGRGNAIEWFDLQAAESIQEIPITGGRGATYINYKDSKLFDIPDDLSALEAEEQQRYNELKERAEKENRMTADGFRQARKQTRRLFCEETNFAIDECWAAYADLNRVIEEKFDRNQTPGMTNLKATLEEIHGLVKRLLDEKRLEEPDPSDNLIADESGGSEEGGSGGSTRNGGGATGAIRDRRDALQRLGEVAAYFQRSEPHSPVAYLVQRAVKWGNMPLESWLMDVIKDENVLSQLRQTLGFDTGSTGWDSGSDYSDNGDSGDSSSGSSSDDSW
jgi:type VI secretion system protein ImpA